MGAGSQKKRIDFAPQDRLTAVQHLIRRFFAEVVQRDYRDFIITDLSDLYDIFQPAQVEAALDRMDDHYFIDSRAANSTRIVDLLKLLHQRGVSA